MQCTMCTVVTEFRMPVWYGFFEYQHVKTFTKIICKIRHLCVSLMDGINSVRHTRVQLGIQSKLNSCKYHLASWATKWHDYVPVDHPPTTTWQVTWDLGSASFRSMEVYQKASGKSRKWLYSVCKVSGRSLGGSGGCLESNWKLSGWCFWRVSVNFEYDLNWKLASTFLQVWHDYVHLDHPLIHLPTTWYATWDLGTAASLSMEMYWDQNENLNLEFECGPTQSYLSHIWPFTKVIFHRLKSNFQVNKNFDPLHKPYKHFASRPPSSSTSNVLILYLHAPLFVFFKNL